MNSIVNNIKQRLSLREPLAEALEVVAKLTDKLALKKPAAEEEYEAYLKEQLKVAQEVCPFCKNFERDFPSFAFSIAASCTCTVGLVISRMNLGSLLTNSIFTFSLNPSIKSI